MILHRWKGSEIIEAAIVFPITILVIYALLSTGIKFMQESKDQALDYYKAYESIITPNLSPEDYLRLKWSKNKDETTTKKE